MQLSWLIRILNLSLSLINSINLLSLTSLCDATGIDYSIGATTAEAHSSPWQRMFEMCPTVSHTRSISVIALEHLFSNLRILITFNTSWARKLFRCDDIPCISWTTVHVLWKMAQPHLFRSCLSKITNGIILMQDKKTSWKCCQWIITYTYWPLY